MIILCVVIVSWLIGILGFWLRKKNLEKNQFLAGFEGKRGILIIAHPDDESMFFTPIISSLIERNIKISVLCLTNGGNPIRRGEFEIVAREL
jgi:N-acetylglucosaminylphosphatidylinositol deacetylase